MILFAPVPCSKVNQIIDIPLQILKLKGVLWIPDGHVALTLLRKNFPCLSWL